MPHDPTLANVLDPGQLNLLVGRFEPAAVRRRRVRVQVLRLAAVASAGLFMVIGLVRRGEHARRSAEEISIRTAQLVHTALGPNMPPAALDAEVARLRHGQGALAKLSPPMDVGSTLASILRQWPADSGCEPFSMNVAQGSAAIAVLVRTSAGAEQHGADAAARFLGSFVPPPGWQLQEPRLSTGAGFTRISLDLTRTTSARTENPP